MKIYCVITCQYVSYKEPERRPWWLRQMVPRFRQVSPSFSSSSLKHTHSFVEINKMMFFLFLLIATAFLAGNGAPLHATGPNTRDPLARSLGVSNLTTPCPSWSSASLARRFPHPAAKCVPSPPSTARKMLTAYPQRTNRRRRCLPLRPRSRYATSPSFPPFIPPPSPRHNPPSS